MPRYINKSPATTAQKIQRAKDYRVSGYSQFLDPFPLGFGTLPEKIVYFELSRRNIPFYYLNDIELTIPEIGLDQFNQADFIIPSVRIIIEVQGAHWHSMPKTIDEDAFKFALYQQDAWTPLAWWDFDILDNVNKLFDQVPALQSISAFDNSGRSTELTPIRRTKTDSSQGIRTLNAKRGQRLQYRRKAASVKTKKAGNYGQYTIAVK
jgi:hypothetical protein